MNKFILIALFNTLLVSPVLAMDEVGSSVNAEVKDVETVVIAPIVEEQEKVAVDVVKPIAIDFDKKKVHSFLSTVGKKVASQPIVVGSVLRQNEKNKSLRVADAINLDGQWRSGNKALIDGSLKNLLSDRLRDYIQKYRGVFTEVFVMDNKGLNVAQSAMTSDYWQGDEAKFIKSYNSGRGAIHIESPKKDEITGAVQVLASLPVYDYDGREVIGVIALAIDLDKLH